METTAAIDQNFLIPLFCLLHGYRPEAYLTGIGVDKKWEIKVRMALDRGLSETGLP